MNKIKGKVWLVGAGPSDIGMLTIKGKKVLQNADTVIYDSLIGKEILSIIPENAEKIYVGKRAGKHTKSQKEINLIILEKALENKNVVRLKGGDSFLFGRGGEELELLTQNNIDFEVVPGVTSAFSVPAYSGIPVTHRDFCSSVHIITAHKKDNKDIDYSSIVKLNGTIIFLMGVKDMDNICKNLILTGMDKNMPAAVIENGTTARQRCILSTVENLYNESLNKNISTPAIIVIGEVCKFADKFNWYDKLPLHNTRIVVTRPREIISEIAEKIRQLGGEVIEFPTIEIVKIENNLKLKQCIENIINYNYIVFTSQAGVKIFFEQLKQLKKDIRNLYGIKIAAIGQATKKSIEEKGIFVDIVPNIYDINNLSELLCDCINTGEKVLIPRAENANKEITEKLLNKNIFVDDVPIYNTIYKKNDIIDMNFEFQKCNIDYVVFTSASTVKGFINSVIMDYSKVNAVCIGKQTADEAKKYNMKTFVSKKASVDSIIDLLIEMKNKK